MPLTGKCYLLVFPEEGEGSADRYRMERGTREERSPTSVSADSMDAARLSGWLDVGPYSYFLPSSAFLLLDIVSVS